MPRWAVAVIASAVVLAMLMLCGVPAWLFVAAVRDTVRSEQQSRPLSGESESGEGTTVDGARPDADLLKTLHAEYPTWRFSSGQLRRQRWATTGTLAWTLDLESRRHPKVMLEVEYVRNLDTHGKPFGAWTTTEGVFNASREAGAGDGLLDAFAGDVSQRPVFVLAEEQVPTEADAGGRPFRVSFHPPGGGAMKHRTYLQWPGNRWTETATPTDDPEEYGFISPDAEVVKGAKPDAPFLAALAKDYPEWKFSDGRFSQQKWEKGKRYPEVTLRLEYLQTLDEKGQPADAWETGEQFFKSGGSMHARALLDRFVRDASARPVLIYGATEDDGDPQGQRVRFSYKEGDYADAVKLYQLEKDGRWTLLP